jgi:aldehyde:ferredoxin oxidoreductase
MPGYHNRLLVIDLNVQQHDIQTIQPERFHKYIGGSSLAARLFLEARGTHIEPLAPNSPLLIMTGPLTGTTFPGSSRFVMCARSPLTHIWGESASGGAFGAELKKAGFDGMLITGRAENPVVILVDDGAVSIHRAEDLWGMDTYQTIDTLSQRYSGARKAKILAIGPAGEHLVKFAAVSNDKAHYFGRTGMGAVMGSKNIKAIIARGTGHVPIADTGAFDAAKAEALAVIKDSMISDSFHALGTAAAMDMGMMTGDVPIKNWTVGVDYDLADAIGGPAISERLLKSRKSCYACPIGCKPVISVDTPDFKLDRVPGPEYETCASFGSLIMNNDLHALAYVNDQCNRLGIDTISCGATIAFMMEAYEKNLLTREQLDGLDLTWGNITAVHELVDNIARRQGFGNLAAEGSHVLAESLGRQAMKFLVTVKRLELPMHDPRAFHGLGLAYLNAGRGACHLQHSVQAVEQGMVCWPETGLEEDYPATQSRGKGAMVTIAENIGQMANAACICHFVHWAMGMNPLISGINAVTGLNLDMETFLETGERAWVLKRAVSNLMGITRKDEYLPARILTPLPDGGAAGSVPDEALMKAEYDAVRGLDETGRPESAVLERLGLAFLIPALKNLKFT